MIAEISQRPKPAPPETPEKPFQEPGVRRSHALPYQLQVHARSQPQASKLTLTFNNTGAVGAVFHVYDRLHLDRIPRRYTVEAGKVIPDDWLLRTGVSGETTTQKCPRTIDPWASEDVRRNPLLFGPCFGPSN